MTVTILALALLVGAIGFIIVATRRMQGRRLTGPMFRRAFQYVVLYALIIVVANGAADLLARAFGAPPAFDDAGVLAQSVTAVVIGLPIAALILWWLIRAHRKDPDERDSLIYQAYLSAAALTGAAMTAAKLSETLTTALGAQVFDGAAVGHLIIWVIVWSVHWRIIRRTLTQANSVAHLLLGSTIGLVLAVTGLIDLLATSLEMLTGTQILVGTFVPLGSAVGLFISGMLLWVVYWLASASKLPRGTLWHAYVLLFGVAGGLITALVGAQALVWRGMVNLLGDPGPFVTWFEWPRALAALVIGAMAWWYHRNLLDWTEETPVRGMYSYLVSGIGAVAAAAGVGLLAVSLVDAITPAQLFHEPLNTLLGAITLLVVGAALWWSHWRSVQRAAARAPETELTAVPRRIYLVILIGAASVAVVIALIAAVANIIADLMENQLALTTLYDIRTEIGYLTAGLVLIAYHAAVLRQDSRVMPGVDASAPSVTKPMVGTLYLVGPLHPTLVATLHQRFDRPVQFLASDTAEAWNTDAVLAQVQAHDAGADLLLIARDHGLEARPIDEIRTLS